MTSLPGSSESYMIRQIIIALLALSVHLSAPTAALADQDPRFNNPMQFRTAGTGGNCSSGVWIDATGEINADTPSRFQKFVESEKGTNGGMPQFTVELNSPGGDIGAAMQLGALIRKLGLPTDVAATIEVPDQQYHFQGIADGLCVIPTRNECDS